MTPLMDTRGYEAAWTRAESLADLNQRIHDGVPLARLLDRARAYRDAMFEALYPLAQPQPAARVLEFGSGVGWIMEAMLERFPISEIVGVDISENMVQRARERFADPRARFVVYDGLHLPFADDHFPVIYSCATIQHIEKHVAFLLLLELQRILAPGGHAVLHFLSVHHMPRSAVPFERECWNHVENRPEHWHHYYAFDELFVLLSEVMGVTDLDIREHQGPDSFFVHFSKRTERRFLRPELPDLTYPRRTV
jgi:ubiquinone/menaquinone biosynthesis C-methylase UbiE